MTVKRILNIILVVLYLLVSLQVISFAESFSLHELGEYFDCSVWDESDADSTPVRNLFDAFKDKGIDIPIREINCQREGKYGWYWISFTISDNYDYWFLYRPMIDGSGDYFCLQLPCEYRPQKEAFVLMLESTLNVASKEAESIYDRLVYNIIDEWSNYEIENCIISLFETEWAQALYVERVLS